MGGGGEVGSIVWAGTRKSAKSSKFGVSRNMGHLAKAETSKGETSPPQQRPFRALPGPPPDGR
eukprot:15450616-Alexandrium_andersonii.AAC.1